MAKKISDRKVPSSVKAIKPAGVDNKRLLEEARDKINPIDVELHLVRGKILRRFLSLYVRLAKGRFSWIDILKGGIKVGLEERARTLNISEVELNTYYWPIFKGMVENLNLLFRLTDGDVTYLMKGLPPSLRNLDQEVPSTRGSTRRRELIRGWYPEYDEFLKFAIDRLDAVKGVVVAKVGSRDEPDGEVVVPERELENLNTALARCGRDEIDSLVAEVWYVYRQDGSKVFGGQQQIMNAASNFQRVARSDVLVFKPALETTKVALKPQIV